MGLEFGLGLGLGSGLGVGSRLGSVVRVGVRVSPLCTEPLLAAEAARGFSVPRLAERCPMQK